MYPWACQIPSAVTHLLGTRGFPVGGSGLGPGCWVPILHQVSCFLLCGTAPLQPLWPLRLCGGSRRRGGPTLPPGPPLALHSGKEGLKFMFITFQHFITLLLISLRLRHKSLGGHAHYPSVDASLAWDSLPQAGGGVLAGCAHGTRCSVLGRDSPQPVCALGQTVWPSLTAHFSDARREVSGGPLLQSDWASPQIALFTSAGMNTLSSPWWWGELHCTTHYSIKPACPVMEWMKALTDELCVCSYILALALRLILFWLFLEL